MMRHKPSQPFSVGCAVPSMRIEPATDDFWFSVGYLRTPEGYEIDLIVEIRRKRWAIEVKLTSDLAPQHVARLNKAANDLNKGLDRSASSR